MGIPGFFRELRRRRVLKVIGIYAVVTWIVIQVAATVFPYLMIPEWGVRLVIGMSLLGLPIAAVLAWAFEVTPDGVQRAARAPESARSPLRIGLVSLAAVVLVGGYAGYRAWTGAKEETTVEASIAVLPFVNMSSDADNEYFSDGMTEELLNDLAQVPGLRVAARTSSFAFKGKDLPVEEIGRRLGVATLLEGSVRKSGGRIRITAQLIDAVTGYHLWSEEYDRDLKDVFAVQGEISRTITGALRPRFAASATDGGASSPQSRPPTQNLAAYEKYLRGKHLVENVASDSDIVSAIALLREATTMDAGFALAFASLSEAYGSQPYGPQTAKRARAAAERALKLDPQLAEGYAAMAWAEEQDWNWEKAAALYRKSIELNPTLAAACGCYGIELLILGRTEEGIMELERARMLDPMDANHSSILAAAYQRMGRRAEADVEARKALAIEPGNAIAMKVLAWNDIDAGRYDAALKALADGSDRPDTLDFTKLSLTTGAEVGYLYGRAGRRADALRVLRQMEARYQERPAGAHLIGAVHVGLGDETTAMQWFERAYRAHEAGLPTSTLMPYTGPLHDNPEYQAMLRRIGIRGS